MGRPILLSALSLTEARATAVIVNNPIRGLFSIFTHPSTLWTMVKSRCLLNEMTAIVGTGLGRNHGELPFGVYTDPLDHRESAAFERIAMHSTSSNRVSKLIGVLEAQLKTIERIQEVLRQSFSDLSTNNILAQKECWIICFACRSA
jgi:hypothetical protein